MTVFDPAQRAAFAALYPEQPGRIGHNLAGHPLFEIEALVALSQRMRPCDVEQNLADLPIGIDPAEIAHNGLSVADSIRSIGSNRSWMVLKFVEQDPAYRALLEETLGELRDTVARTTGAMIKLEGFIFVSSPNAVTPFHFDPEHNILLQLSGTKTMTLFPVDAAAPEAHEAFHRGAHRNLPWHDDLAAAGRPVALAPGEAVYVPVKTPHWVRNGPETSISFSITWRSEWSYAEADAHALNHLLRRAGLTPRAPKRYPHANRVKSVAWRAINKAKQTLGR